MNRPISPELALAFACCRWPRCETADAAVRAAASEAIDWERFAGVIARNRIGALAKEALDRAGVTPPAKIAAQLAQGQSNAAFTSLALARESIRLQRAFDAAGLPALIVKGAPMAMLAYGDLGRKESWDIDLLSDPDTVMEARHLLERLGYSHTPIGLNDAQFSRLVPHAKEAAFLNSDSGITVELHWRLVDNALLLAGVGPASETQSVSLGAGAVRTLADGPLFAYLCVHGAAHNWSRLKWLADVGAFLGNRSGEEVAQLYHTACGYGAQRPAGLALLLCHRMLGLKLPEDLEAAVYEDTRLSELAKNTLAGLEYGEGTAEHLPYTQAWLRTLIGRLFHGSGSAYIGRELRLLWTRPLDRASIALPAGLQFLYHALRIPLWALRIAGRHLRRLRSR